MKSIKKDVKYLKAKRKVTKLKDFYRSLITYVIFISLLAGLNYYLDQWRYPWFLWAAFGWGIGLIFQGMKVYDGFPLFGKNWEERKVKEFMEKEAQKQQREF